MTRTETPLPDAQQLYVDWEGAHWSAHDIDLSRDRADMAGLDDSERLLLYFALSSLMVAEERISTQFVGLVLAQDDEEDGSFLCTQLVDEVRHMQFYARFQSEVVTDPSSIGSHVARSRAVLEAPFRLLFDEALVQAHARLVSDPRNRAAKVDFVTIYHLVLEGTLGVTTSHFLLGFLRSRGVLPGFVAGYSKITADEGRHITYGTQFLRQAVAADRGMGDVVRRRLHELMPAITETLSPPDSMIAVLGAQPGALVEHGLGALRRRLEMIGVEF